MCGADIFLLCLSVLFPPIGVWVKRGICSADSLINIALCVLGYLPGLLHAWYIIISYPDEYERVADSEGHVTYYYVAHGPVPAGARRQPGYGTVGAQPGAQFPGQQTGTANAFAAPAAKPAAAPAQQPQPQNAPQYTPQNSAAGPSDGPSQQLPPPSYADVIKGDNKIQSQD